VTDSPSARLAGPFTDRGPSEGGKLYAAVQLHLQSMSSLEREGISAVSLPLPMQAALCTLLPPLSPRTSRLAFRLRSCCVGHLAVALSVRVMRCEWTEVLLVRGACRWEACVRYAMSCHTSGASCSSESWDQLQLHLYGKGEYR